MSTEWSRIRRTDLGYKFAFERAHNQCEGKTGPRSARCPRPAEEVIEYRNEGDGPIRAALCVSCRQLCFGKMPAERSAEIKQIKQKQPPLFAPEFLEPTEDE